MSEFTVVCSDGTSNAAASAHIRMTMAENIEILTDLDDQISLENTASHCRLNADKLSSQEAACFPDVVKSHPATQKLYLYIRNAILQMWMQNVRDELTFKSVVEQIAPPYQSDLPFLYRIHAFLERWGYINYGHFRITSPIAPKPFKIIVVGAGIAGLIAGRQLRRFGFDVVLLEARNRVGGRIATFKRNQFVGDLGAMIVTGLCGNPVAVLARQIPMDLKKIRSKCPLFESGGTTVDKDLDETVEREFNRLLEATTYISHSLDFNTINNRQISLGEALELLIKLQEKKTRETTIEYFKTLIELQNKQKENLHQLLRCRELITALHKEVADLPDIDESDDCKNAAGEIDQEKVVKKFVVLSKKRDLAVACKKFDKIMAHQVVIDTETRKLESEKPLETYLRRRDRQILDWHMANLEFANATPLNRLSLKHWDQDDEFELSGSHMNGVKVVTTDPETLKDSQEFSGDAVLCTLPLGVLKFSLSAAPNTVAAVNFTPQLPEWKSAAITRLGFGNLNKVVLCFDRVFWTPDIDVFGYVGASTSARGELFQFWSLYDAPILIGLVAGESADRMEELDDNIIIGRCLAVLRDMFGSVPQPKDQLVTKWRADPWARGSYSFVGTESSGDDYDLLAAPLAASTSDTALNRVFFAGEHTIRNYPATVHGALLSGLREAGRIADQFLGISYGSNVPPDRYAL